VEVSVLFHTVTNFHQQRLFNMISWNILAPRLNKVVALADG